MALGCSSNNEEENALLGHWSMCHRDGKYAEQINNEKEFVVLDQNLEQDSIPYISIYKYWMENDSVYGVGLSENTIKIDTFKFYIDIISDNQIVLSSQYLKYDLHKINSRFDEVSEPVSNEWIKNAYSGFEERRKRKNCLDLRSEEEKKPPPFGYYVEDEFEDLIDFDSLKKKSRVNKK